MTLAILFALFALIMISVLLQWRRVAGGLFLLALALSFAVFLHHATDTLAISL